MLKEAVTVLLINEERKILAVSRKNDLNDFGLPGGKVEPGESLMEAAIRETKEETGLNISDLKNVFIRQDDEYIVTTFIANNYSGNIHTNESGRVAWVSKETLIQGCFGLYNKKLFDALGI